MVGVVSLSEMMRYGSHLEGCELGSAMRVNFREFLPYSSAKTLFQRVGVCFRIWRGDLQSRS